METYRLGIVGAGHMGKIHARILKDIPQVEIVGIADIDLRAASRLASEHSANYYTHWEEMLPEIDIIFVATPNTFHTDVVLAALERDIHVFCEKPMAATLEDARRVYEAANSSRGRYQLGFNKRFTPVYRTLKELIVQGFKLYSAHIKRNRGELQDPFWVSDRKITGGFLNESTVHLLDLSMWLFGDVVRFVCWGKKDCYHEYDDFHILFEFSSGLVASFTSCAHSSWVFPFESIEVYGEHSSIITEEMERITHSPGIKEEVIRRDFSHLDPEDKWGYRAEDIAFIEAIVNDLEPAVSQKDGLRSAELVEALYQSIE